MTRVNELKENSEGGNEEINKKINTTTATQTVVDSKLNKSCEFSNEDNKLETQITNEKAAAKIFPLNLISNRFKLKDSNALKGRYFCRLILESLSISWIRPHERPRECVTSKKHANPIRSRFTRRLTRGKTNFTVRYVCAKIAPRRGEMRRRW